MKLTEDAAGIIIAIHIRNELVGSGSHSESKKQIANSNGQIANAMIMI